MALQLRRSGARRHRRARHRRRRTGRVRRNRLRAARTAAAATTAGATAKGAHDNVTSRPPAFLPLVDPIHEYGRASGSRSPAATSIAAPRSARRISGRYFFADFVAGTRLVARADDRRQGEARASGLIEHTAELGGTSAARQHQLVRRRRRRRALYRQPTRAGRFSGSPACAADTDRAAHHPLTGACHGCLLSARRFATHCENPCRIAAHVPSQKEHSVKRPAFWILLWSRLPGRGRRRRPLLPAGLLHRRARHHDGPRAARSTDARAIAARDQPRAGRLSRRRHRSALDDEAQTFVELEGGGKDAFTRDAARAASTPPTPGASGTSRKARPTRRRSASRPTAGRTGSSSSCKEDAPGAALDAATRARRSPRTRRGALERRPHAVHASSSRARSGGRAAASITRSPTSVRRRR